MPCLLAFLAALFPRVALVLLFLFTTFLQKAYSSLIVLVLGFLFLPLTTIVYAFIVNGGHTVDGVYLVALIVSILFDLGLIGHGEYHRRRR
jgi:hypothetical protein